MDKLSLMHRKCVSRSKFSLTKLFIQQRDMSMLARHILYIVVKFIFQMGKFYCISSHLKNPPMSSSWKKTQADRYPYSLASTFPLFLFTLHSHWRSVSFCVTRMPDSFPRWHFPTILATLSSGTCSSLSSQCHCLRQVSVTNHTPLPSWMAFSWVGVLFCKFMPGNLFSREILFLRGVTLMSAPQSMLGCEPC